MKKLRKLAGISIFLILLFMVIALFQYQREDELPLLLPDQIEYYFNENWMMTALEGIQEPEGAVGDDRIQERIRDALAQGECREINLPYAGESRDSWISTGFRYMR